jgi:4'-phosphopantetheinyl transferase EntD
MATPDLAARILLHHATAPPALRPVTESRWLAALPAARRERLLRLRDPRDRAASLAGLALLLACARAAGWPAPPLPAFEWPERGKPRWPGGPEFSISHGGGRVGCAIALPEGRVGLDIEAVDAADPAMLRTALARGAWTVPATREEATALWVAKEAVVKAVGATIAEAARVEVAGSVARFDGLRLSLRRPVLGPRLACAVASDADLPVVAAEEDVARLLDGGP